MATKTQKLCGYIKGGLLNMDEKEIYGPAIKDARVNEIVYKYLELLRLCKKYGINSYDAKNVANHLHSIELELQDNDALDGEVITND